jgi:glycosidase
MPLAGGTRGLVIDRAALICSQALLGLTRAKGASKTLMTSTSVRHAGFRNHCSSSVRTGYWNFLLRRSFILLFLSTFLFLAFGSPAGVQAQQKHRKRAATHEGKPIVERITPPNWWSGLPNPMLLLRGKNLSHAEVTSGVAGISVERTEASANGHWKFVWLDISTAPPQKFSLVVRNSHGATRVRYELEKRHPLSTGFGGFSSDDVMYLILPDRFSDGDPANDHVSKKRGVFDRQNPFAYHGGDLAGIENHLDYLQQLGVTAIWVAPLYAQDPDAATDYSGYAPVDLYRLNPHFGTMQDYEDLAKALHSRGMKLVLDMVMNHVGPKSPWVADPPAPDWFHGTPDNHLNVGSDFEAITDPHAPPAAYRSTVDGWFLNSLPDLNQANPLVQQYLIQNAIWWIESGTLDGLRLDSFPNVDRAFWQQFHSVIHALYPNLTSVGEVFDADPTVVSYFAGGAKHGGIDTGLYTLFDFPTYTALRGELAGTSPEGGAPMTNLGNVERQDWLYPHPYQLVTFFGNQDAPRFLSEPGASVARLKLAFGLIATLRGMPQLYYGDEIAMAGGSDVGNRSDFPGGFPGDTNDAFTSSGRTAQQNAMYEWVQGLLNLRKSHPALQEGVQQNLLADQSGFVFARIESPQRSGSQNQEKKSPGEMLLVLVNKSAAPRLFQLDFADTALEGVESLQPLWNTETPVLVENGHCAIRVGANQLIVLAAKQ